MIVDDELDARIARALNDPLQPEEPPLWSEIERAAAHLASSRKRRHSPGFAMRIVAIGAVAVGISLAALTLTGSKTSLMDAIAAAVAQQGPVVHLVLQLPPSRVVVFDPGSGRQRSRSVRGSREIWYDRGRQIYKEIVRGPDGPYVVWVGRKGAPMVSTGLALNRGVGVRAARLEAIDPVAQVFSRYREALASGQAELDGEGTLAGHRVVYLRFYETALIHGRGSARPPTGSLVRDERIALDKTTYQPVAIATSRLRPRVVFLLKTVGLVSRRAADLAPPRQRSVAHYGAPTARRSRPMDIGHVSSWLRHAGLRVPEQLGGLRLELVDGEMLNPANKPVRRGVRLTYGATCNAAPEYGGTYLVIQEAPQREPAYWTATPLAAPLRPHVQLPLLRRFNAAFRTCHAPKIGFYSPQDKWDPLWVTAFRTHGLYVSVSSPKRQVVLNAVRSLLKTMRG